MSAEEQLGRLLAAWRAVPSERVARLIARVDRRIRREPIEAPTQNARHARWFVIEAAGDPADVPRLVSMVTDSYPARCRQRIRRLAARPPDPRIASAMLELVARPPDIAWVKPASIDLWPELATTLEQHGSPYAARALASLVRPHIVNARVRRRLDAILADLHAKLAGAEPELPAEHVALCAEVEAEIGTSDEKTDARLAELLAAVYADPSDRAARLVYADALLEAGDPRGEFIQLQLARTDDAPHTAREVELLSRYGPTWLGTLATMVRSYELRGGFLWGLTVADVLPPHDPVLSTVVRVQLRQVNGVVWVSNPVFRALREVQGLVGWHSLAALGTGERPLAIERVSVEWWPDRDAAPLAGVTLPCLPALRELEITAVGLAAAPMAVAELLSQACLAALARVRVSWGAGATDDWKAVFAASHWLRRLEVTLGHANHVRLER